MLCLTPTQAELILDKIRKEEITPKKIAELGSAKERRAFFAEFLGEEVAIEFNAQVESKLLLKDWERGLVTMMKHATGITEKAKIDLISRVSRLESVLRPDGADVDFDTDAALDVFLEDLAAHKLGVAVSMDEAAKIYELAEFVKEKELVRDSSEEAKLEHGTAVIQFHKYIDDIKSEKARLGQRFRENPIRTVVESFSELVKSSRTMKATLDDSYIGRQGIKALYTHPKTWLKRSLESFSNIKNVLKGQDVMDAVKANIVSRDNSVNGKYKDMGLAVSTIEEEFPTTLPEKLPVIGRLIKAADVAFTAQAWLTRADLADIYIEKAEGAGINLNDKDNLKAIGGMVNSLTGRGRLGKAEPIANVTNVVLFSARFFASNIQVFTQPFTGAQSITKPKGDLKGTNFVRKQAAINLAKIVGWTALVLATASALGDDDTVEWDPRSVDFGKIRIGDTRIDVTGGMSSIVVLASRIWFGKTKSSTTGIITDLTTGGFIDRNKLDVLVDFAENKLSPVASVLKEHFITGETFEGETPTLKTAAIGLYVPIPVENYFEMQDNPDSVNTLVGVILDGLGFGSNTYSVSDNWNNKTTVEMTQFKEEVGQKEFDEANDEFNRLYIEWFKDTSKDSEFQELSDDDKSAVISKQKGQFKRDVLKDHDFKVTPTERRNLPEF